MKDKNENSDHEASAESADNTLEDNWMENEPQEKIDDNRWVQVNQAHYDPDTDRELVTAVVRAVAEAKGVDPLDGSEIPPLYESIDVEILEDTFYSTSQPNIRDTERGIYSFQYCEHKVVLRTDGWIFVYEPR